MYYSIKKTTYSRLKIITRPNTSIIKHLNTNLKLPFDQQDPNSECGGGRGGEDSSLVESDIREGDRGVLPLYPLQATQCLPCQHLQEKIISS